MDSTWVSENKIKTLYKNLEKLFENVLYKQCQKIKYIMINPEY